MTKKEKAIALFFAATVVCSKAVAKRYNAEGFGIAGEDGSYTTVSYQDVCQATCEAYEQARAEAKAEREVTS